MNNIEYTLAVTNPGSSQKVTLAGGNVSNATALALGTDTVVVTPTQDCFFRKGAAPVAVVDGTDQFLVAKNTYRIFGLSPTDKLAFNSATAGDIYITPGA